MKDLNKIVITMRFGKMNGFYWKEVHNPTINILNNVSSIRTQLNRLAIASTANLVASVHLSLVFSTSDHHISSSRAKEGLKAISLKIHDLLAPNPNESCAILLSLLEMKFKLIAISRAGGGANVVDLLSPFPLVGDALVACLHSHDGARRKTDNSCQVSSPLVMLYGEISSIVFKFLADQILSLHTLPLYLTRNA